MTNPIDPKNHVLYRLQRPPWALESYTFRGQFQRALLQNRSEAFVVLYGSEMVVLLKIILWRYKVVPHIPPLLEEVVDDSRIPGIDTSYFESGDKTAPGPACLASKLTSRTRGGQ